jgi:hypothetical protein
VANGSPDITLPDGAPIAPGECFRLGCHKYKLAHGGRALPKGGTMRTCGEAGNCALEPASAEEIADEENATSVHHNGQWRWGFNPKGGDGGKPHPSTLGGEAAAGGIGTSAMGGGAASGLVGRVGRTSSNINNSSISNNTTIKQKSQLPEDVRAAILASAINKDDLKDLDGKFMTVWVVTWWVLLSSPPPGLRKSYTMHNTYRLLLSFRLFFPFTQTRHIWCIRLRIRFQCNRGPHRFSIRAH